MKKILPFILLTIIFVVGCIFIFTSNSNLSNNNVSDKQKQELKNNKEDIKQDSINESNNIQEEIKESSIKKDEKIETNNQNDDIPINNSNSNVSSKQEEVKDQSNNTSTSKKEENKDQITSNNNNNNNDSSKNETKEEEKTNTTQPNENKTDATVEFYKSITHGIKEFSSESDALARGYEITNNELDYVLDWNEKNPDNPIQPDINYFRVYPSAVDENGNYWYYLHFFCISGEDKDTLLKSKY